MQGPTRALLALLAVLSLAGCGIDASDMNRSGHMALSYELPDEATKYFGAARDLIVEGTEGDDLTGHPQYARMRSGELMVLAWSDPDAAFAELQAELEAFPELLDPKRAAQVIDLFVKLEHLPHALWVAEFAAERFPDADKLATKRENLRGRVGAETGAAAPSAGPQEG